MINFEAELIKLTQSNVPSRDFFHSSEVIAAAYKSMETTVSRFDKSQKEMFFLLEDMSETIGEIDSEDVKKRIERLENVEKTFVEACIQNADLVEDFYLFAIENGQPALINQAALMWNMQQKNLNACGITRIHDENTAPNTILNTIAGIGFSPDLPQGFIIKTLRSGYMYKNQVVRKSSVIINNEGGVQKNE